MKMEKAMINEFGMRNESYYMEPVKFIRDLVHNYIYLTEFDLELIDTPEFQRLKDIRQLTCQSVYPEARHTRFEHSLGVMELTRQAMKNLNKNGIIAAGGNSELQIFDKQLLFNAGVAALLHDVGHCPFSHMGESEFDNKEVWERLYDRVCSLEELQETDLLKRFKTRYKDSQSKKPGSIHEQLGCIVVLKKYYDKLKNARWSDGEKEYYVDFELIIRSILGIEYNISTIGLYEDNKRKNIVIQLINSKVFDMDKLDYIMRDSFFAGIGTPQIDTYRLFKNMYLNSEQEYSLVFTHRAEPVLQNMIEARDKLYMYVYNHHAAVFSDFMYSYIFRRLARNAEAFIRMIKSAFTDEDIQMLENTYVKSENEEKNDFGNREDVLNLLSLESEISPRTHLGIVPQSYLFSVNAIVDQKRSDSDMISLLHDIHYLLSGYFSNGREEDRENDSLKLSIIGEIEWELSQMGINSNITVRCEDITYMIDNIRRIYVLIDNYQRRKFLKPWWKTNFEFADFINHNFRDDHVRQQLCAWICQESEDMPAGDEFRSQIAKHVIYITQRLFCIEKKSGKDIGLLEPLADGEFFVIKRAAHFYETDAISQLDIALKNSEIVGSPNQVKSNTKDYYIKELINIIPISDYYSMYPKQSFYIFSKPLSEKFDDPNKRTRHYHLIEQIFIFVATQLIKEGCLNFQSRFVDVGKEQIRRNEIQSRESMLAKFIELNGYN